MILPKPSVENILDEIENVRLHDLPKMLNANRSAVDSSANTDEMDFSDAPSQAKFKIAHKTKASSFCVLHLNRVINCMLNRYLFESEKYAKLHPQFSFQST